VTTTCLKMLDSFRFATGSDHYIQVLQPDLVTDTAVLVIDRAAR